MAESHSRTTVKSRLSRPLNGVIYQTPRRVSSEYPLPLLGANMEAELGSAYADSIVISASLTPDLGKEMGTITHAQIPSESAQLASNWEHSTCDIGGMKFDSVQRTVIMLASAYSESSPAIGSALAANPGGSPNLGSGYVLADRQNVISGTELEPVFRVERRNYVQKVTLGEVEVDQQTGIASRSETTLYFSGETVITGQTINQLMANPAHEHWATREDGFARSGTQLSECWYSVTDRKLVDLQPRHEISIDRRRPQQFFCPQQTVTATVTTTNNTPGEPSAPTADIGQQVEVVKVGRIQKVTTTTQSGAPLPLKGTDFLADDGYIYPETTEIVSSAAVPSVSLPIGADGRIVTFQKLDACNSTKTTSQGISIRPEYIKSVSKLVPQEFLDSEKVSTVIETKTGAEGEPTQPIALAKQAIKVRKKGVVETKETTTQQGESKILKGLSYLPDDGSTYASEREILDATALPPVAPTIQPDGTIETYEARDANFVIRQKRQAESLLPGVTKKASRLIPEKFLTDKKTLQTDQVETGVIGDPPEPVAAEKKSVEIEQRGKIRRRRTIEQLGNAAPVRSTSFDERTGESFLETEEVVSQSAVTPTPISASGEITSFDGIDANQSVKRRRKLVSTMEMQWTDVITYEWPPVLTALDFVTWTRKDGRTVIQPIVRYKQGFSEPQTVRVRQWWQKNQPQVIVPVSMISEGIQFWCPLYNISIPPCLHSTVVLRCNIGSSDPDWAPQSFVQSFPATNVTDWPESIVWTESKPYLGGYLIFEYTLNRPS